MLASVWVGRALLQAENHGSLPSLRRGAEQQLTGELVGPILVIYFLGVLGLYININWVQSKSMSLTTALKIGFLLPLPGDLVKMGVATLVTLPARERLQALMTKDA